MINKHSIYNWLFFPLLASLLAGSVASCINDPAMEETTSGKSTLSITVRGVTTNPEQDGYDEYIKTLRIIGFDEKGVVVYNKQHSSTDFLIENGVLNITQPMEDAFQGGVCDFYFVANENGYNVHDTQSTARTLSAFLSAESLTKDELMNCVIAYTGIEPGATNTLPILMTTSVRTTLRPGDNTINNIKLVRCFAKIQLKIVDETGIAHIGDENKLTGTYPDSYSLWNGGTYIDWNEGAYSVSLTLTETEDNAISYTSQEIYFPERLFDQDSNTEDNALKFSFTLNGTSYTAAVADATGTDFNIRRNTHYTVIATLKKKETVTFNVMVNAWGEKTMDVPAFE